LRLQSYVTYFLMRGCICRLELLLVLPSALILMSESRGTHDHILLSQIRDSLSLESQVPIFISPKNMVAICIYCDMTPESQNIEPVDVHC
jgi:hypothetical protein